MFGGRHWDYEVNGPSWSSGFETDGRKNPRVINQTFSDRLSEAKPF
jgi:hypothetical protein